LNLQKSNELSVNEPEVECLLLSEKDETRFWLALRRTKYRHNADALSGEMDHQPADIDLHLEHLVLDFLDNAIHSSTTMNTPKVDKKAASTAREAVSSPYHPPPLSHAHTSPPHTGQRFLQERKVGRSNR
jgi:hypothetical protein